MKIVNYKKFFRSIVLMGILLLGMLILLMKNTYSTGDMNYKEEYILQGDTIWSIAEQESKNNSYYEDKDVRKVVYDIKTINQLNNNVLKEGEKIKIPCY